jgi:hypothetical protein
VSLQINIFNKVKREIYSIAYMGLTNEIACYITYCIRIAVYMMFVSFSNNTTGVTSWARTASRSVTPEFLPRFFGGVRVAHLFCLLCCPIMWLYLLSSVLYCPLRFPHKNDVRFVNPQLVVGRTCIIYVICVCLRIVVLTHIVLCLCFVFPRLVYPMLSVSLDCPFLIAPSVFSNVYLPLSSISNIHKYWCM